MKVWFDMDGTIANLYGVEGWLDHLYNNSTIPYEEAKPMFNFSKFARKLNVLRKKGHEIGIISWTSKCGDDDFHVRITEAKKKWLHKHLPSVQWNEIKILKYGTNKWEACKEGVLFDDEENNRKTWMNSCAFSPDNIFEVLNVL